MSDTLSASFPSVMRDQLRAVRTRRATYASVRALAIGLTALLMAILVAMSIDWAVTLFDTRVRVILTVTSLMIGAVTLLLTGRHTIRRALGWTTAAEQVDQRVPQLEERWLTVASLTGPGRAESDSATQAMLVRVTQEAVAMSRLVKPDRVVSGQILRRPLLALGAAVVALGIFFASHWGQTSILWQRFWSPTQNITATQLAVRTGDVTLPRGDSLEVVAQMQGLQRDAVDLVLRRGSSLDLDEHMTATPINGEVRFPVDVDETLSYRVQAGDGRTEWYTLTAIDYPELKDVQLTVTPPKYVDEPPSQKSLIPSRLRVVQGSELELAIKPQIDLKSLTLQIAIPVAEATDAPAQPAGSASGDETAESVETLVLKRGDDGWYRFETTLVQSFSLTPLLTSRHDLQNKNPRVCRIEVVEDHAPVARIVSPSGEGAANLDEKLDIRFEAHDDHGIATAELVIYEENPERGEMPKVLAVRQIPLGDQAMQKHVMGKYELDLKELGLKEGTNISYSVRVTDNRNLEVEATDPLDQLLAAMTPQDPMPGEDPPESRSPGQMSPADKSTGERSPDAERNDSQPSDGAEKDGHKQELTPDQKDAEDPKAEGTEGEKSEASKTGDSNSQPRTESSSTGDQKSSEEEPMATAAESAAKETDRPAPSATDKSDDSPEATESSEKGAESPMNAAQEGEPIDQTGDAQQNPGSPKPAPPSATEPNPLNDHPAESLLAAAESGKEKDGLPMPETGGGSPMPPKNKSNVKPGDSLDQEQGETPMNPMEGSQEPNGQTPSGQRPATGTPAAPDATDPQPMPTSKETPPGAADDPGKTPTEQSAPAASDESKPAEEGKAAPDSPNKPASEEPPAGEEAPFGQLTLAGENDPQTPMPPKNNQPSESASNPPSSTPPMTNANGAPSGTPQSTTPPKVNVRLNPQMADSGQQQETDRRKLRIVSKLEAVASSNDPKRDQTQPIRDKVIQIDMMLEGIEKKLTALYSHNVVDSQRADGFRELDALLKNVEVFVVELNETSRETVFEFVGLQMIDISSSHVTPARDAVFIAIRTPDSGADVPTEEALHHVVSARELLQALLKRYDSVAQEQQLADKLDKTVEMYTIYVERSQRLMREAQQNRDPLQLQREMEVVKVDQAYLDRLAEVTRMRRDMMTELARILVDDPRLRSRYLDLIKRRRSSIGNQLGELAARQDQTSQEVIGWMSVDDNQRESYWQQLSDLRLDAPHQLAKEAQQLADRIDKQLPLVLDSDVGAAAAVVSTAKQIALAARRCDFDARELRKSDRPMVGQSPLSRSAESLVYQIGELSAALDRLQFEGESLDGVADYIQRRQIEVQAFADIAETWAVTAQAVERQLFPQLVSLDQHQLAIATELLRTEMLNIDADLAGQFNADVPLPQEVTHLTQQLQTVMESITHNQTSATFALTEDRVQDAAAQQELALKGFEEAQKLLNELRRKTAEALDKIQPPDPNIADLRDPTLDQFLAELEREPNIEAQLGIPARPRNIRFLQDAMTWNTNGGQLLGASSDGAMGRIAELAKQRPGPDETEDLMNQRMAQDKPEEKPGPSQLTEEEQQQLADAAERQKMLKEQMEQDQGELEKQAQDPAKSEKERRHLAEMAAQMKRSLQEMEQGQTAEQLWRRMVEADQAKAVLEALAQGEKIPDEQWNKLMSTLGDGQGQVTGRVPSEDYRQSIEQYQERLRQLTGER